MFQVEKVNCICVDWRRGSRTEYTQAAYNTRVVGAEIAFLVQVLSVIVKSGAESENGVELESRAELGRSGVRLGRIGVAELEGWS